MSRLRPRRPEPARPGGVVGLALSDFLLGGEAVLYESEAPVRLGLKRYLLCLTGERLVLYSAAGPGAAKEQAVAQPLAAVSHVGYSAGRLFGGRARLEIRFGDHTLKLSGEAETLKEVWRVLQQHAQPRAAAADGAADDEVTLVARPLPPLFEGQDIEPVPVEPLGPPARRRAGWSAARLSAFAIVCAAALAAALLLFSTRGPRSEADAVAPSAPTPAPTPAETASSVRIADEVFTLEPGSHRAVKFVVPAEQAPARVTGGFRVTAGSYVDFFVMGERQYDDFAGGASPEVSSAVYRQGQWNARVGETLPAGNFYLVFDNPDAQPQTVAAEFHLVNE